MLRYDLWPEAFSDVACFSAETGIRLLPDRLP